MGAGTLPLGTIVGATRHHTLVRGETSCPYRLCAADGWVGGGFIRGNRWATRWGMPIVGEAVCRRGEKTGGSSQELAQFCCEPKTTLKIVSSFILKNANDLEAEPCGPHCSLWRPYSCGHATSVFYCPIERFLVYLQTCGSITTDSRMFHHSPRKPCTFSSYPSSSAASQLWQPPISFLPLRHISHSGDGTICGRSCLASSRSITL